MHPDLATVFAPVQRDLVTAELPVSNDSAVLDENPGQWANGTQIVVRIAGTEFPLTRQDSHVDRIVELADRAQEWLMANVLWSRHHATSWPACPHHPDAHPLDPGDDGDRAVWVCPADGIASHPSAELRR